MAQAVGTAASAIGAAAQTAGQFVLTNLPTIVSIGGSVAAILLGGPTGQDIVGPRAGDTGISTSTYGTAIPFGHGQVRLGCNLIWTDGRREVAKRQEQGGKGGGGGPTATTFTYFQNVAFAYAEGEVDEIRRIWMNSKLVYDSRNTTDLFWKYPGAEIRFFPGSTTQLQDTFISSVEGADLTPAYRGLAYMMIENLPLADFGNGLPSISLELIFSAVDVGPVETVTEVIQGEVRLFEGDGIVGDPFRNAMFFMQSADDTVRRLDLATNSITAINDDINAGFSPSTPGGSDIVAGDIVSDDDFVYVTGRNGGATSTAIYKLDAETLTAITRSGEAGGGQAFFVAATIVDQEAAGMSTHGLLTLLFNPDPFAKFLALNEEIPGQLKFLVWIGNDSEVHVADRHGSLISGEGAVDVFADPATTVNNLTDSAGAANAGTKANGGMVTDRTGTIWAAGNNSFAPGPESLLWKIKLHERGPLAGGGWEAHVEDQFDLSSTFGTSGIEAIGYDPDGHALILAAGTGIDPNVIIRWDIETEAETARIDSDDVGVSGALVEGPETRNLFKNQDGVFIYSKAFDDVYKLRMSDLTLIAQYDMITDFGLDDTSGQAAYFEPLSNSAIVANNVGGSFTAKRVFLDRIDPATVALSTVVDDLFLRAGIVAADQDTAELTDTMTGYAITARGSVRAAIDVLTLGFFFDVVESDFQLKCPKRGKASSFTVVEDDLGAILGAQSSNPRRITETRQQEVELPVRIDVAYSDLDRDYQRGNEYARRTSLPDKTQHSNEQVTLELPVVFPPQNAARIAEQALYMTWSERDQKAFTLLPEFLDRDPSDVLTLNRANGDSHQLRIKETTVGRGLVMQLETLADFVDLYTSSALSSGGQGFVAQTLEIPGMSRLFVLNVPLLRDAESTLRTATGPYVAVGASNDTSWKGAVIQRTEDGQDWTQMDAMDTQTFFGTALTTAAALPAPYKGIDATTTLTVAMGAGRATIGASTITEAQLLNRGNPILWGDERSGNAELCHYQTAVDNGDGTVTLTNFLRAQRGTERAARAGHVKGDKVMFLLPPSRKVSLTRDSFVIGSLNQTRVYRATSIGDLFDNADFESYTIVGTDLKPYEPVQIEGTRDGSNNLTITWVRQTRVGQDEDLVDGIAEVPLSEDSESYDITILDAPGGNLVATYSTVVPLLIYTAAQQTADGLTPGDPVDLEIFQISAQVGRGFPGAATV